MRLAPPPLRLLLLAVILLALALPLGGLLLLRMYESALIRQTESELVAQGAVLAAAFKAERGPIAAPPAAHVPGPLDIARRPGLDLATDPVLPSPPDPAPAAAADPAAAAAGARLAPVLREAQGITLASLRLLDAGGTIVASTGADTGRSLAALDEVRRALRGEPVSTMRQREHKATWVPEGISRGAMLRVFVALPVIEDGRLLGAVLLSRTPADIGQALWGKRWPLAGLAAALLAAAAGLAFATSRLVTRPLATVAAQAGRVAAGETGAVLALQHPGTREVAALSAAIARMADTLDRRAQYVRSLAAHIAHEFKTPLAATAGAAELLADHPMSDQERARFLGVIQAETARLDRLTRRLLELARADMAAATGPPLPVGPALHAATARWRGLNLAVRGDGRAAVDPDGLALMLDGLLDNARTHAGPDAAVTLDAAEIAGRTLIRVADNGPGVSAANAARIFQPFFTTARDRGGSGLGLSIVQALAQAARGTVRLEPSARGAAFVLDLPASPREPSA